MNLVEVLVEQARVRPEASAIIESRHGADVVATFAELERRSARVAALLRGSGVKAGETVLIFHPLSADLYVVLLAVFRLGAVAMFLDPSAGREHIERCCELLPPRALIAGPKAHLLRLTSGALRRIPAKLVIGSWLPGAVPIGRAQGLEPMTGCEVCASDAQALVTFTSGSTGVPKATVRTHGFLLAQHRVLERHLKLAPGEVDLTTLPVFLLANLASGVTSVVPDADLRSPGAVRAEPVLGQIARHGVMRTTASPAFLERLLGGDVVRREALRGLRKVYTGGAPVFPRLLDRLCRAAPDAEVEAVYGSTEAEPIAPLSAREIRAEDRAAMRRGNGLLAGKPIPELRLRIIRDQWGKPLRPLSVGEFAAMQLSAEGTGEIVVTGEHVMRGYLHGRGDEETKFSVGGEIWHRTGDAGKLDVLGRLWLLGRCAARIQDGRGEVYPFAVECVATEHESVRRAAFVGLAGRRVLAVEPEKGFDEATGRALRQDLAWAGLDDIHVMMHLPVDKRHNAKIDYPALRRML